MNRRKKVDSTKTMEIPVEFPLSHLQKHAPPKHLDLGIPSSLPNGQAAAARQRCAAQSAQLAASLRSKLTELEVWRVRVRVRVSRVLPVKMGEKSPPWKFNIENPRIFPGFVPSKCWVDSMAMLVLPLGLPVNSWMEWLELAGTSRFLKNEDIPSYGWGKAMVIHKPLKKCRPYFWAGAS